MNSKYLILLAVLFSFVSCIPYEDFESDYIEEEGQFGDWTDFDDGEGTLTLYEILGNDLSKIKDFQVSGDLLSYQQDYAKHFEMWNFVTRLLPEAHRSRLVQFEVFHGGGELYGFVEPISENDLSQWKIGLAIDVADKLEEIDLQNIFTYVTIHEYGHVLTLNETQIQAGANSCNHFFTYEGCAEKDSYLNKIFELGWKDIYSEFEKLDEDEIEDFYQKYKSRFVSDYAASNPGEDAAEVFATFVIESNQPTGNSIADQKVKMMYERNELVELRNKIRANETVLLTGETAASIRSNNKFKLKCRHHNHHKIHNNN